MKSTYWARVRRSGCCVLAALGAAAAACAAQAAGSAIQKTAHGIRVSMHGQSVQIAVAGNDVFRLSYSLKGPAHQRQTIFLAPRRGPLPKFTVIHEGGAVGIRTAFGSLLLHRHKGFATLLNRKGRVLTSNIVLQAAPKPQPHIGGLFMSMKPDERFYGSGSDQSQMTLSNPNVKSYTGNGAAYIPYYWSTAGYGVFVVSSHNNQPASRSVQGGQTMRWTMPGRSVDVYLMPASSLYKSLTAYTGLTGRPLVPPEWAFGYLQSRWGWKNWAYLKGVVKEFRSKKLPLDAVITDFEWYTPTPDYTVPATGSPTYHDFRFNPVMFPHPKANIQWLAAHGVHWMGIRKPRLGSVKNLNFARQHGWLLDPHADPVDARDINFALPAVRRWWYAHNEKFVKAGISGWWDDEGEARFTLYYYWNLAEMDGLARTKPNARTFELNRSFCPGVARLGAAVWTGDTPDAWHTLRQQPPHLLNYGLAGMPLATCDMGGFYGTEPRHLFARFAEANVFFPIMRAHSSLGDVAHFPWKFGAKTTVAVRHALDLRYRLIPLLYSLAHRAYEKGWPIMRPLVMQFPHDRRVRNMTSEWLVGRGLLVAPLLTRVPARVVYLPKAVWYRFNSNKTAPGPAYRLGHPNFNHVPMYVRQGTILPLGPVIQDTQQLPGGPLTVQVYPGKGAHFTLVEDDGTTYNYEKGIVRRTAFVWHNRTRTLAWKVSGPYRGKNIFTKMRVVVFFPKGIVKKSHVIGKGGGIKF